MSRRAGALLLAVALVGGGCSARRAKARSSGPDYRRVSPSVAFELLRDSPEDMLIVDLRTPAEFFGPLGHLRGARSIPLAELGERLRELWGFRQQTILVYCRNDGCGDTGMTALRSRGFENPVLMEGGLEAWVEAGYRTEGVRAPVLGAAAPIVAPPQIEGPQPELVYMRLSDGAVLLREAPPGLHVAGRMDGARFAPDGRPILGAGAVCGDLGPDVAPLRSAWRDIADGALHVDEPVPQPPPAAIVRGCVDGEGKFHPSSRMVEYR